MKANNIKNIHETVKREADERSDREFVYNEAKWWEIIVNKPDSRINSRMLYNRIFNKSGLNFSEEEKQEMESLKEVVELLKTFSKQVSVAKDKQKDKEIREKREYWWELTKKTFKQAKEIGFNDAKKESEDIERENQRLKQELDKAKEEIAKIYQENEKLTHKFRFFLYLDHKKNKLKELSKKLAKKFLLQQEKKFDKVKRKVKWDVLQQKYVVQIQVNPKN